MESKRKSENIYKLKITLKESKPSIWRRILVSGDTSLPDLHKIVQTTMGWTNSHLHQFIKNQTYYSVRMQDDDFWDEMDNVDYKKIKLSDLLKKEKEKIIYEYDFGDGWEHNVILEKILPFDEKIMYPICLTGKMNCPPEDCGGIWGYRDLLKIMANPDLEEYDEWLDWLGGKFDPEEFDPKQVNEMLNTEDYGVITILD